MRLIARTNLRISASPFTGWHQERLVAIRVHGIGHQYLATPAEARELAHELLAVAEDAELSDESPERTTHEP